MYCLPDPAGNLPNQNPGGGCNKSHLQKMPFSITYRTYQQHDSLWQGLPSRPSETCGRSHFLEYHVLLLCLLFSCESMNVAWLLVAEPKACMMVLWNQMAQMQSHGKARCRFQFSNQLNRVGADSSHSFCKEPSNNQSASIDRNLHSMLRMLDVIKQVSNMSVCICKVMSWRAWGGCWVYCFHWRNSHLQPAI